MALQFRRGTDAERQQIEFAAGEPVYVTDTGQLFIGDGETEGGRPVLSNLVAESNPQLGDTLDLNSNNITGTGNIAIDGNIGGPSPGTSLSLGTSLDLNNNNIIGQGNIIIDGYINASGSINLGDSSEDDVTVGGQINSPLIPAEDGSYDLGTSELRWRNGFFQDSIYVNIVEGNLLGSLYSEDSSIIIDQQTRTIFSDEQFIGNIKLSSDDGTIFRVGSQEAPIECYIHSDSSGIGVGIFGETETFPGNTPNLSLQAFRGTLDNPDIVQNGDSLGLITFGGYNGQDFTMGAFVSATVDDQTFSTGDNFDTKITIGSLSGIANNKTVSINSEGQLTSKILTTGGFETSNLPTGSDVGVGSIVFDTITSQFKGWNGTDWIVLG